ncbi:MAG: GbsR/MarR family transcriptional regulator [Rubricoccaceae bacterium]
MEDFRQLLTEDFGQGYVRFGHSELMGRVVGLLLATVEPLSEEQIAAALHVSKSPINQITRRLEELSLVRRVRLRGDRRYYYQIAEHVFLTAGVNQYRLYEQTLQVANTHLGHALRAFAQAEGDRRAELRVICERLIRMREFHLRMIEAYRRFVDDWRATEGTLPSVEDYLATWEQKPLPGYSLETIATWPG